MKRTWGVDVLDCHRCGSRMELLAAIEDDRIAARILRHLGLPTTAPPRGRPWSPQRSLAFDRHAGHDDGVDTPSAFEYCRPLDHDPRAPPAAVRRRSGLAGDVSSTLHHRSAPI